MASMVSILAEPAESGNVAVDCTSLLPSQLVNWSMGSAAIENGDGDFGARDPMAAIPTPVLRPRKRMIWEICEFIQTFILNSLGSGLCGVWCVVCGVWCSDGMTV